MRYSKPIAIISGLFAAYFCGPWFADIFQGFEDPNIFGAGIAFVLMYAIIDWALTRIQFGRVIPIAAAAAAGLYVMAKVAAMSGVGANTPLIAGGVAFLGVWFAAHRFLWPTLANATSTATSRVERGVRVATDRVNKTVTGRDPVTIDDLEAAFDNGEDVRHKTSIDRRLPYNRGNSTKYERLAVTYTVSRNTLMMSPQERAGLVIWHILKKHGVIHGVLADNTRFGLIYSNGNGRVQGPSFKLDALCAQQYGLRNIGDAARLDASFRAITSEGAVSTLLGWLQSTARGRNPDPEIVALYERYCGPMPPRLGRR